MNATTIKNLKRMYKNAEIFFDGFLYSVKSGNKAYVYRSRNKGKTLILEKRIVIA